MTKIWLVVTDVNLGYQVMCAYSLKKLAVEARDKMNRPCFDDLVSEGKKVENYCPPYYLVGVPVNVDAERVSHSGYDSTAEEYVLYVGQWPKDD